MRAHKLVLSVGIGRDELFSLIKETAVALRLENIDREIARLFQMHRRLNRDVRSGVLHKTCTRCDDAK